MARKRHVAGFFGALTYLAIALVALTYGAVRLANWSRGAAIGLAVLILIGALRAALRAVASVALLRVPAEPLLRTAGKWVALERSIEACFFIAAVVCVEFNLLQWDVVTEPPAEGFDETGWRPAKFKLGVRFRKFR